MNRKTNDGKRKKGDQKKKERVDKFGKFNARSIRIEAQKQEKSKKSKPVEKKKK